MGKIFYQHEMHWLFLVTISAQMTAPSKTLQLTFGDITIVSDWDFL